MDYIYLFETKSIQSYLSRSGKLRDVVDVSDLLAKAIDTSKNSLLHKVLDKLGETHNLSELGKQEVTYNFIRCKGGTYYCYSNNFEKLEKLRTYWTLLFSQHFPYLNFVDALLGNKSNKSFTTFLRDSIKELTTRYNAPSLSLPYATTIVQNAPKTGFAAVKTVNETNESIEKVDLVRARIVSELKRDTNRSLYKAFMQDKPELVNDFYNYFIKKISNQSEDSNVAIIHMDGNGIGQLLINVDRSLTNEKAQIYSSTSREFSELIGNVTSESAKEAFSFVHDKFLREKQDNEKCFLFRPLVLGGDDLTIIIEAKYAIDYALEYAKLFKKKAELKLQQEKLKKRIGNIDSLSVSGGVLFNKINHPFTSSISLVTELADDFAKKLTKLYSYEHDGLKKDLERIGDSAIAFFRMNVSSNDSVSSILEDHRSFVVKLNEEEKKFYTGGTTYYSLKNHKTHINNFYNFDGISLEGLLEKCHEGGPENKELFSDNVHSHFRRMLTELSKGDFYEACKIYNSIEDSTKKLLDEFFKKVFSITENDKRVIKDNHDKKVYWCVCGYNSQGNIDRDILVSILDDINVLYGSLKNFR